MNNDCVELFVIKDVIAEDIGPVFSAKNVNVAIRSYKDLVKGVHDKSEYQLVRVGLLFFDDQTGNIKVVEDVQIVNVEWPEVEAVGDVPILIPPKKKEKEIVNE